MSSSINRLCFVVLFVLSALYISAAQQYEVTARVLNVRALPSADAMVLGTVGNHDVVNVLSVDSGWACISYNGATAYVAADYLDSVEPSAEALAEKDCDDTSLLDSWSFSTATSSSLVWFYAALVLSVLTAALQLASGSGERYCSKEWLFYFSAGVFLALSVCELFYFLTYSGDTLWFCKPGAVGWILTVVDFIAFGFLVFEQLLALLCLVKASNYHGYRSSNINVGYYGWIFGLIAVIAAGMFFEKYVVYAVWALVAVQLVQIGVFIYYNIKDGGNWCNLALTLCLYIVGSIATVVTLLHFLGLLLIVLVVLLVLSMIGSGPSACCGNCATYSNGYCSYRQCSVSSGDCCNKHISR